jgi:hypothetical protein
MEYVRCKKAGGDVWFPTLTFNDDNLPIWRDPEHDFECQVMDAQKLKRFRDHLRVNIERAGYPSRDIRFEFVTEYGTDYGRLHHHALIFVPYHIPEDVFVDCIERAWAYKMEPVKYPVVKTKGPHKGETYYRYYKDEFGHTVYYRVPKTGYVMWSDEGKTINDASGIRYVQKYITKPQEWIEKYGILEYEERLKCDVRYYARARKFKDHFTDAVREAARKHCFDVGDFWRTKPEFAHACPHLQEKKHEYTDEDFLEVAYQDAVELLKRWRSVSPKHLQSTFFGIDGIDYYVDHETGEFDVDKLTDGRINLGDEKLYGRYKFIDAKHPDFLYNMPTYYFNKIFKSIDEHGLSVYNELYDQVYERRFNNSQDRLVQSYRPYFDNPSTLSYHLSPLGLEVEQVDDIFKKLSDMMHGRDVRDLVLYQTVYQGRRYKEGMKFIKDNIYSPAGFVNPAYDGLSRIEVFHAIALPFMRFQHHLEEVCPIPTPERMRVRSNWENIEFNDHNYFGHLDEFTDFDYVLDTIRDLEEKLGDLTDQAARLKMKRTANIMKMRKNKRKMSKLSKLMYDERKK